MSFQVFNEIPDGLVNSTDGSDGNGTFYLAHIPVDPDRLGLFKAGVRQTRGVHFTIAGRRIDYVSSLFPLSGDTHLADYEWDAVPAVVAEVAVEAAGEFTTVTDHVARALTTLIEQYKGKPKVEGLITAFVNQVQDAEDGLWTLWSARQFDATAGAAFLDLCGRILGEPRNGKSDASYLIRLRAKVLLDICSGTIEEIYAIFVLITAGTGVTLRIKEWYPKAFTLELGAAAVPDVTAADYANVLRRAKDAGAKVDLLYGNTAPLFGFDRNGSGFDVGYLGGSIT